MRIMLTVATMATGGAERIVLELARALGENGDVVAVAADEGPMDPAARDLGVARYIVPGYGRSPVSVTHGALALRRALRAFHPDLVHSHNVKATGLAAVARASMRGRAPLVATFHGVHRRDYRGAARVLRFANTVVCVSDDLAAGLARYRFPRERLRVIPNAVPIPEPLLQPLRESLDRELGLEGHPVVSLVGRLVPQKVPERFLRAAAGVAAEVPECRFLVVGDGPLRTQLEATARATGVDEIVRFTGMRQDARVLIARSDVVAFSSDWEGMSIVALEALAAGVPVVATDVEGMRELLGTGAGVLVERDSTALAAAIVDLLGDSQRRARMGRTGRDKVAAEFSLDRMVDSYRELYRNCERR